MKTLINILALLLFTFTATAQNEDYKMVGGVHAGWSLVGSLVKNVAENNSANGEENVDASATPALQLTFDYGISKVFSLGLAVSYQNVNISTNDFFFTGTDGVDRTGDFKTNFNRTVVSLRPLFHYANNDKLDLYSGLRIGFVNASFSDFKGDNAEVLGESIFDGTENITGGTRFAATVTLFGMRYYFTDMIGAGFELNLGAPYIANIGVSARF